MNAITGLKLTPEQIQDFKEKTKILIKWLNDNAHPHAEINITNTSATLTEGITAHYTEEFIKD